MKISFDSFLSTVYPAWEQDFADLPNAVDQFSIASDELLPAHLGYIYYIAQGAIGEYDKDSPKRYILAGQLIITPLKKNQIRFKALRESEVYYLDRKTLYHLSHSHPQYIELYDLLREQHEHEKEYREYLLSLDKAVRLEHFRKQYASIIPLIPRQELASYLSLSRESLRKLF